jgi:ASC-1-like (ASCH) protein
MPTRHLAIFIPPYLDLILQGKKTIESRFSKVRSAPYERVKVGDIVLMKRSGGMVEGEFTVAWVETFCNLTTHSLQELARVYTQELCADADARFWDKRSRSRYATFMSIAYPLRYAHPFPYPKRDRRGWVVLGK